MNPATSPIYIRKDIHAKLKTRASREGKKLYELCEELLGPLVKRQAKNGVKR